MTRYYHTIFNLLALSIVIYTGVGVFYRVVRARLTQVDTKTLVVQQHVPDDKGHQKPPLDDYQLIVDRNILGSADTTPEEVEAEEIEALEPTSMKVALLGTVTGNPQNAVAVIEETGKRKQGLYKVGDSIENAVIKMILRGKVVLRVENRDEILTMEEAAAQGAEKKGPGSRPRERGTTTKGRRASRPSERGTTITVSRSEVEQSLENVNKLLSEVRVRPHFRNGKPDGLALSRIKKGSLFAKLGLKNGDVVQGMNDSNIESPDDMMALYKKLKSGSRVKLQIKRRGQTETINYRFR
jgi:general secretion pathway protein C